MSGSRNFCQFYLVLSLFYSLKRGSNCFIAEKTILRDEKVQDFLIERWHTIYIMSIFLGLKRSFIIFELNIYHKISIN